VPNVPIGKTGLGCECLSDIFYSLTLLMSLLASLLVCLLASLFVSLLASLKVSLLASLFALPLHRSPQAKIPVFGTPLQFVSAQKHCILGIDGQSRCLSMHSALVDLTPHPSSSTKYDVA